MRVFIFKSVSKMFCLTLIIYIYITGGDCPVLEERCDFSYIWEDPDGNQPDVAVTACRDDNNFEGSGNMEGTTEIRSEYVCPLNVALFDEQKTWGICNDECLEENGG